MYQQLYKNLKMDSKNTLKNTEINQDDRDNYRILNFIFPFPNFSYSTLESFDGKIIYIPTNRKLPNSDMEEKIPCIFIKKPTSQDILIIYHCNGVDMFTIYDIALEFSEIYNINILIPEYPDYSIYDQSPKSSETVLKNSLIIYDFLLKNIKGLQEKNIYVLGRSLGTCPTIYTASIKNPAAIFLISPYTTFAAVGEHSQKNFSLLEKHFRSIDYIGNVKCPMLIIHGKNDDIINYKEAVELYEKAGKKCIKHIELFDNMTHNYFDFKENIEKPISSFIKKFCGKFEVDFDEKYYKKPEEI